MRMYFDCKCIQTATGGISVFGTVPILPLAACVCTLTTTALIVEFFPPVCNYCSHFQKIKH